MMPIQQLNRIVFYGLTLLLLSLGSCTSEKEITIFTKLQSSTKVTEISNTQVKTFTSLAGFASIADMMTYDVEIYYITYKTEYLGEEITASGVVSFPKTSSAVPMLSFQHGTIVMHNSAPTKDDSQIVISGLASMGYIFLMPDYLGFGSSEQILHPYYRADITGKTIVDMLQAVKELAEEKNYKFNEKVFLAGYSEGGFATMAAHKKMEESPMTGFELVASAPASGGYDIKGMQEYFFGLTTYHQPYYMAYVAMAYKTSYNWDEPLRNMFNEPYATSIPTYFDGQLSSGTINSNLTSIIGDYIQADILVNIDSDTKYAYLVDAFENNSLDDWVPTHRMMMYHGTADITVPYQNSVDTYDKMIGLGASNDILTFESINGANHATGVIPYITSVSEKFNALK